MSISLPLSVSLTISLSSVLKLELVFHLRTSHMTKCSHGKFSFKMKGWNIKVSAHYQALTSKREEIWSQGHPVCRQGHCEVGPSCGHNEASTNYWTDRNSFHQCFYWITLIAILVPYIELTYVSWGCFINITIANLQKLWLTHFSVCGNMYWMKAATG